MKHQSEYLWSGTDVVYKADKGDQCQGKHEPGVFKMARQKISQYTKIKDDPSTTQSNAGVRTTFIRLVDDITFISDAEIKKFCKEEQN